MDAANWRAAAGEVRLADLADKRRFGQIGVVALLVICGEKLKFGSWFKQEQFRNHK